MSPDLSGWGEEDVETGLTLLWGWLSDTDAWRKMGALVCMSVCVWVSLHAPGHTCLHNELQYGHVPQPKATAPSKYDMDPVWRRHSRNKEKFNPAQGCCGGVQRPDRAPLESPLSRQQSMQTKRQSDLTICTCTKETEKGMRSTTRNDWRQTRFYEAFLSARVKPPWLPLSFHLCLSLCRSPSPPRSPALSLRHGET